MFNNKPMNYNTYSQMTTPTYHNTPESVVSNNNNKRIHNCPSENLCKRRRVSPLSINTVKRSYPVYVQQQQPVIVTNYYKPQVNNVLCKQQQAQPQPQQKQPSKQQTVDISNQFPVTPVSEVFQGCSELSLPKLVIYLIYKIWCCCSISQYKNVDSLGHNNGYITPKPDNTNYSLYSTPVNHAKILSPVTPSNSQSSFDCIYDKVDVLYKNICQSKIFEEQSSLNNESKDSEVSTKNDNQVDPKDLEMQILKACSRSCRGELKNNYSKLIDYVDHLLKVTQISFSSVILALEYIYRLKEASQTPEGKFLNQWSYEEIIPVAFMMANKYVSDDRYSNTVWANVTNFSLKHLNELEMKGLVAISFRLYVTESSYNDWINLIKKVSRDLTLKYNQRKNPQSQPKVQVPIVSYKLSPNPYTTMNASTTNSTQTSNTAIYSPMTPSKIQQNKNIFISRNQKSHVINIVPQNVQAKPQLLPTLPVTRVIKTSQPTVITVPANQRMTIPPFQGSTFVQKVQTTANQSVVFFPKVNVNSSVKSQPVVRQNVCIYPAKNTIYPSPPLSRTASPTPEFVERYVIQNKNTIVPQYIQPTTQVIVNPFIKGFQ